MHALVGRISTLRARWRVMPAEHFWKSNEHTNKSVTSVAFLVKPSSRASVVNVGRRQSDVCICEHVAIVQTAFGQENLLISITFAGG